MSKKTEVHYEILSCDHMNNLKLANRTKGVCPKGCSNPKVLSQVTREIEKP